MFAHLIILVVASNSWSFAFAELCRFPPGNPIEDLILNQMVPVEVMHHIRLYVYTDELDMEYRGCVRAVTLCYSPRGTETEEIFSIQIRHNDTVEQTHYVTLYPADDMNDNCEERYNLNNAYCCVEYVFTAPFFVNQNRHYALGLPDGLQSLPLRHLTETVNGSQINLNNNSTIDDVMYKPLFYFTIDTSQNSCNSNNLPPYPPTDSSPTTTDSATTSTTDSSPMSTTDINPTSTATNDQISTSSTEPLDVSSTTSVSPTHHATTHTSTTEYHTPTTAPSLESSLEAQSEDPSNAGPIAAVIVVILVILIILTIAVIVTIMCIKKKQRQRKVIVSRAGEETGGIMNIVYGATTEDKMSVSVCLPSSNDNGSTDKVKQNGKHQYECIEDLPSKNYEELPASYTYASEDILPPATSINSYAAIGPAEVKRPSLHDERESIYEAPASSVSGLYAQFDKIKIATIPRSSVVATECLGSGQFGTVNKGMWQSKSSTLDVAIKTLNSSAKEMDRVKFLQEGAIMGQFKHPNVVKLHGIIKDDKTVLLVIELLAKTDLREHLLTLRPQEGAETDFSLPHTLLSFCRQVAAGMFYLSKKGFIHRDIAARNILLSEDYETCKIADFGMSRDLADETYYISSGGKIPVKWTAPEALHYKKYSTASDVWSFGCLMYEIWSLGHKPYEGYTNTQAIKMVDGGYRLLPPAGCPRALYQLMISCWHPKTSERLTTDTLTQSLARSDTVLLKWNISDKPANAPLALQLGGPLESTTQLYLDLQRTYLPPDAATDNDYEEPTD